MSWGQGVRSGRHARDHGRLGTMRPARLFRTDWSLGEWCGASCSGLSHGLGCRWKADTTKPSWGGAESGRPVAGSPTQPAPVPNQAISIRHVVIRRGWRVERSGVACRGDGICFRGRDVVESLAALKLLCHRSARLKDSPRRRVGRQKIASIISVPMAQPNGRDLAAAFMGAAICAGQQSAKWGCRSCRRR